MQSPGGYSMSGQTVRQMRCGASVWTTFRFLANLLYGLCWIVALPVELLLNRRMGRRYTGFLPLLISLPLLAAFILFTSSVKARLLEGDKKLPLAFGVTNAALWTTGVSIGLVVIALMCQRFASWLRFRGADQVYSFSNGIPFWLYWPRFITSRLPKLKEIPPGEAVPPGELGTVSAESAATIPSFDLRAFLQRPFKLEQAAENHAKRHLNALHREVWLGLVPTGPMYWIMSTIAHPLAVIYVGGVVRRMHEGLGWYLALAGLAILVKARIQKAIVVEAVYDLFDAKIEHDFTRSLATPVESNAVERTGFAIPGLARAVVQAGLVPEPVASLPKEYADLLARPGVNMEPKPDLSTVAQNGSLVE